MMRKRRLRRGDGITGKALQLEGKRIIFKIPKLSNAESIYRRINDKSVVRYTTIPYPYRLKHAREWIRRVRRNLVKQVGYEFSIFLKNGNEVIGGIGLMHIDRKNQNAEVGYWLARKYWEQASKRSLETCFRFRLRKVENEENLR